MRPHHRHATGRAGARTAVGRTAGGAQGRDRRCGHVSRPHGEEFYAGRSGSRRRPCRRITSTNWARANWTRLQGRMDAILEVDWLHAGPVGARMTALAKDPKLQVRRRRQGARRDHGVHQERLKLDSRAAAARVQHAGRSEHGSEAAVARRGTWRAQRLRRRGLDRRQDSRALLDQPAHDGAAQQVQPRRPHVSRSAFRATSGRASTRTPCRSFGSCCAFNAYSEGWALYAQQLADELGAYDADPVGRLGYLQSLRFRACRLVVDTGIHAKRWTREQGVEFFVERNGSNPVEVAAKWIATAHGQARRAATRWATARSIGSARSAEGGAGPPKYDLKAFDDTVVHGGNVPLDVLGKNRGGVCENYNAGSVTRRGVEPIPR